VILTEGEGFEEDEWDDIQKTVLVENTVTAATINLQTGVVAPVGSTANVITPLPNSGGDGTSFRAVVIPQTVAKEKTLFSLTIDNKTYKFTREEPMVYYPGKLHQFTFDVQKSIETGDYLFTLTAEAVTPWDNDPESHNGTAREYVTVHVEEGQFLGDVIEQMGLDPASIVNLKLTGVLTGRDQWGDGNIGDGNFFYIHDNMPLIEAINMKELRTKNMRSYAGHWEGGWGEFYDYGQPQNADDYIPSLAFQNTKTLAYKTLPSRTVHTCKIPYLFLPLLSKSDIMLSGIVA